MASVIHHIHLTDNRTVLAATLKRPNSSGVNTADDLTGLTVEFKLVDSQGVDILAQTSTGVTVTDAANGQVQMDFADATVASAQTGYGYFVVTESGDTDHFPVKARDLEIIIHADA